MERWAGHILWVISFVIIFLSCSFLSFFFSILLLLLFLADKDLTVSRRRFFNNYNKITGNINRIKRSSGNSQISPGLAKDVNRVLYYLAVSSRKRSLVDYSRFLKRKRKQSELEFLFLEAKEQVNGNNHFQVAGYIICFFLVVSILDVDLD